MIIRTKIRWRLNIHFTAKQQTRDSNCSGDIHGFGFRVAFHPRIPFRPEVLDDHFLNVPVMCVHISDSRQAVDALLKRLPDPDENSGREGDGKLTRFTNHPQSYGGVLIWSGKVRHSAFSEPGADVLEHQSKADIERLE